MLLTKNIRSFESDNVVCKSLIKVKYYDQLKWLLQNRFIKSFEVCPSFQLSSKEEHEFPFLYTADFKIINLNGSVDVIDLKSMEKDEFYRKKRELKERFSCKLSCITYDEKQKWIDREKLSWWSCG
ncbi:MULTISPECIES: DUF1064 domain-containing protein [Bacillus amyloliquefaciens group]|uniref:DUF1064 domain-containing protein n=1 Tax=Bacillus amyloliquefaciens group TaxID=1938374 RepID=UPI0022707E5A|nr:DUF1064 domain-containing protein [Bacillus velezensis]MCY0092247.1 DUF1064 domain-containing protein [Bacillus velezensis]